MKTIKTYNEYINESALIRIEKEIDKIARKYMEPEPYRGGAGPTVEQMMKNNEWLLKLLGNLGVKAKLKKNPNLDEPMKDVYIKKGSKELWVSYDRWGFVIEGDVPEFFDQISGDDTIKEILKWYDENVGDALDDTNSLDDIDPKIKHKILILHALSKRGVGGEKKNAKRFLEEFLKKYNVTL